MLAELVGDDGWQLPGTVPIQAVERIAAEGSLNPRALTPNARSGCSTSERAGS